MKLLKNKAAYRRWKKQLGSGDSAPEPERFPCFAHLAGVNYGYEEDFYGYLYTKDISLMLCQLNGNDPTVEPPLSAEEEWA